MSGKDFIKAVQERLTKKRRYNFLIIQLCPLLAAALIAIVHYKKLFPRYLTTTSLVIIVLLVLVSIALSWRNLKKASAKEAASYLDKTLSAKDRFLTLATTPLNLKIDEGSLKAIDEQSTQLARDYSPESDIPYTLDKPAKYSAVFSTLLLLCLIGAAFSPSRAVKRSDREEAIIKERAEELRQLAENSQSLPDTLKEDLFSLASILEEEGLASDETFSSFEETMEALSSAEEQLEQQQLAKSFTPPANTSPPKQEPENEKVDQSQEPKQADSSPENKQNSKDKESNDETAKDGKKEPDNDSAKAKDGTKDESKNDDAGDDHNNSAKNQAREKPGTPEEEKDPNKDTTGVGEGKGKGKTGDKKDQKGEAKAGSDDSQAKDGDADNKHEGKSSNAGGKDDGKNKSADKNEQANSLEKSDNPSDKNGQAKSEMSQVKEELSKLKNELSKDQGDSKDSSEQQSGEQQSKEQGKSQDQNEGQEGQPQKDGQGKQQQGKQQQGDDGGKSNQSKENKGSQDKQQQGQNKGNENPQSKGGDEKGSSGGEKPEQTPGQNESTAGKEATNRDPSKTPSTPGDDSKDGMQDSDEGAKKRPERIPEASDSATRFGPFDGGKEGGFPGRDALKDKVEVPLEEKIVVRSLGKDDGKLYKNPNDAKAKTELGSDEFKKPDADTSKTVQPIPVEYGDILH